MRSPRRSLVGVFAQRGAATGDAGDPTVIVECSRLALKYDSQHCGATVAPLPACLTWRRKAQKHRRSGLYLRSTSCFFSRNRTAPLVDLATSVAEWSELLVGRRTR